MQQNIYKMIEKLAITALFICLANLLPARGQENPHRLNWHWNNRTFDLPEKINPDDKLLVTVTGIPPKEIEHFLKLSTIETIASDNTPRLAKISLFQQISNSGDDPHTIINSGQVNELDLGKLISPKAGEKILIHPYLGKNVVPANKTGSILVEADLTPISRKALNAINNRIDSNVKRIDTIKKDLQTLASGNAEEHAQIRARIQGLGEYWQQAVGTANLTGKQLKKLRSVITYKIEKRPYFQECNECMDFPGDLIYDLKCEQLIEVRRDAGNTIGYYVIDDLSSIKVNAQKLLRMKIVGINRYLYNIKVTVADSIFGSQMPAIFNEFFGGSSNLVSTLINNVTSRTSFKSSRDAAKDNLQNDPKYAELLRKLDEFQRAYNELVEKQIHAYLICDTPKCCGQLPGEKPFSYYTNLLSDINFLLSDVELTLLREIPQLAEINTQIATAEKKGSDCDKRIETLQKEIDAAKDPKKDSLIKVKEKLQKGECNSDNLAKEINALKEKLPVRQAIDRIKAQLPSLGDLQRLYLFDRNIVKDHYLYRLPPIYPQGDRLTITIETVPIDTIITKKMGFLPTQNDPLNLEFSVRNKWLVSFSSGPYFAFGGNLPVKSYGWQQVAASGQVIDNNATFRLIETGTEPLPVGIGGYINLGKKLTSNFGLGGTVGVGVALNQNALVSFMGGLTGSFGDRQRINFTFGVGGAQVQEFPKDLYLSNTYKKQPDPPLERKMKFGFFFCTSYSIFTSTSKINLFSNSK